MIKKIQYVSIALFVTFIFEGLMTFGKAFDFKNYDVLAWIMQGTVILIAVTTALRVVEEG